MLFDEILTHIGEFGVHQIVVYVVLGLTGLLNGWNNMAVTFTGAKMDHWCQIGALGNLSYNQQKYIMAPPDETKQQDYSQCFQYKLDYGSYGMDQLLSWNRTLMVNTSTPTIRCSSWVYDKSVFVSTIRSKWDLVCEKDYLVQIVQTCFMTGFLVGSAVFGQLSDIIGRLKTLIAAIIMQVIFCLAGTFIPIFGVYCVFRFFVGFGVAGGFTIYTVLVLELIWSGGYFTRTNDHPYTVRPPPGKSLMELIGPRYRVVTGIMAHDFFTLGVLTMSWFSWAIRDHAKLELLISVLSFVLLLLIVIAPESPRWLVSVGRDEDAKKVLEKMATINGTTLPEELHLEDNRTKATSERQPNVIDLLRSPKTRVMTLLMWFSWFATCTIFYGLSLGVRFLKGSIFVNNTISALVQTPAHIITAIALEKLGRRWPLLISYLLGGIFSVACIPLVGNTELNWLFTTLLMTGKACSAGTFSLIYVYAAELFPTNLRNVGVGSSSTVARIGGLIQPQLALSEKIWKPFPFLIYGCLSLAAAVIAFFLPETKGRPLPETLDDIGKPVPSKDSKEELESGIKPIPTVAGGPSGSGKENLGYEANETPIPTKPGDIEMSDIRHRQNDSIQSSYL